MTNRRDENDFSISTSSGPRFWPGAWNAGFSLLELLLNIALVTVLAAVSVPMLTKTLQSFRGIGDARIIANQINVARMRAAA